jgi:hypothetical protein
MVTGPSGAGEQWDLGFIAFYPNAAALPRCPNRHNEAAAAAKRNCARSAL